MRWREAFGVWSKAGVMDLLLALDGSQVVYWTICGALYAFMAVLAILPALALPRPAGAEKVFTKWLRSDGLFLAVLAAMLLAFRWPLFFVPYALNLDEAGHLSQALTLRHDPVFWRSISAGTSGPLNIYPQYLLHLLGFPASYATSRALALAVVFGSLVCLFATFRRFSFPALARLGTMLPATFFAATVNRDFTHCSSEHVPMLLLMLGTALALRLREPLRRPGRVAFLAGLVLGAVPFAKLQGGVIAIVVALFSYIFLIERDDPRKVRLRLCVCLTLGGLAVPFAIVGMATVFGAFGHFWQSYVLANVAYAGSGWSFADIAGMLPLLSLEMTDFVAYAQGALVAGAVGGVLMCVPWCWRDLSRAQGWLLAFACALLAISTYAAFAPGRPFPHYFLFCVFPLVVCAFLSLAVWLQISVRRGVPREAQLVAIAFWSATGLAVQIADFLLADPSFPIRGRLREVVDLPKSDVALAILKHASPGEPLLVWGWMSEYHVQTGMWCANSDLVLEYLWATKQRLRPGESYLDLIPDYFKDRCLADFRRANPPVFVDAVAPESFWFEDRSMFGYETFPRLAALVAENYVLLYEMRGVRIFVRKDRLKGRPPLALLPRAFPCGAGQRHDFLGCPGRMAESKQAKLLARQSDDLPVWRRSSASLSSPTAAARTRPSKVCERVGQIARQDGRLLPGQPA